MWIYLLRHGIAEDPGIGQADEDRSLTKQGRERLDGCRAAWRRLVKTPDIVIASPLLRARQTAEVFADAVGFDDELRIEPTVVPGAPTEQVVLQLESELLSRTDSVAIVGHEPHLGYLLGCLLTGHAHMSLPLKKGMLVAVETDSTTSLSAGLRFALTQKAAGKLR